jgi:CarD family transcriptional regulator
MRATEVEFKPGDRVVYPNQGVCRITGVSEKEISGQKLTFVLMQREEDSATVMVPKEKLRANGIRKVASEGEIKKIFSFLAEDSPGPELDWKVRSRAHGEKLAAGDLRSVAEVVKALQSLSEIRPLPPKERETYDSARHLLVGEIAVGLAIAEVTAEDAIDLALYPPGVERKKPVIAIAPPAAGGDDFDVAEDLAIDEDAAVEAEEAEASGEEEGASEEEEAEKPAKGKGGGRKPKAPPKQPAKAKSGPPKETKPAAKPGSKKPPALASVPPLAPPAKAGKPAAPTSKRKTGKSSRAQE